MEIPPPPPIPSSSSTTTDKSTGGPTAFPSTFAPNQRAQERAAAAAQLAHQAQQHVKARPGKGVPTSKSGKQRAWVDSDEDEEEEQDDDDDSSDEGAAAAPKLSTSQSDLQSSASAPIAVPTPRSRNTSTTNQNDPALNAANYARRQSYYENGPSRSPNATSPMPASPIRGEFANLRPDDLSSQQPHSTKPIVSPHGLLYAGILDKEERSARALESQARTSGGTLVNLPSKPPPPQTGLVGAITSHEREKERTGGVGRALAEQQKDRKLAEQVRFVCAM